MINVIIKITKTVLVSIVVFTIIGILGVFIILFEQFKNDSEHREHLRKLQECISTQQEFTFADVFEFEWDEFFYYPISYGDGKEIKEEFGYEFEIHGSILGTSRRFLFFNNGELVYDMWFTTETDIDFNANTYHFNPNTKFIGTVKINKVDGETYYIHSVYPVEKAPDDFDIYGRY